MYATCKNSFINKHYWWIIHFGNQYLFYGRFNYRFTVFVLGVVEVYKTCFITQRIKICQGKCRLGFPLFFYRRRIWIFFAGPFTFNFLATFKLGTLGAQTYLPSLEDYIDTLVNIILGCGIAFELPVLAYVLSKIGLITPQYLRTYRKYAYVIILILAAVITPSPDWTSQLIMGIPLVLLYEISILISAKVAKEKAIEDKQWD